jgi:DNA primase
MKKQDQKDSRTQALLNLKMKAMKRIFDLLDYFGYNDFFEQDEILVGSCPVHNGDNPSAWNINIEEDSRHYGLWFCNTKQCHKHKGHDIVSLVNLLLDKKLNKKHTFVETIKFLESFTKGVKAKAFKYEKDSYLDLLSKQKRPEKTKFTKADVRKRLKIPSQFYINRGFKPETLDEFDIGLCLDPSSSFYNRVVFPIYDDDDKYLVGCVGRTVTNSESKWINKKGFNKSNHLYNYGKSLPFIEKSGSIIIVEGQGDVLRLWESGIKNCVGIFGCHLSDSQEFMLQRTGALNLIVIMDNDEAGKKCRQEIRERLSSFFNIIDIELQKKDVGEMTVEEVNKFIKPKLIGMI